MADNQSPAVERILASASTSVRILQVLVGEPEGRAHELLRRHGWPATDTGVPELPTPEPADRVVAAARDLGFAELTTDHLLVGLLEVEPRLREWLAAAGTDCAKLFEAVAGTAGPALDLDGPIDLADPTDALGTGRALDASANRAREALRVVEDYCRFVLDDRFLTEQLKRLRHDLAEALRTLPESVLLAGRETARDVGTAVSVGSEGSRADPRQVARANLSRAEEALRSLEEFGKIRDRRMAALVEQIRYRTYTLERAVLRVTDASEALAGARLYVLLTGARCVAAMDWTIREAAAGGATAFQLREKNLTERELLAKAKDVRRWTEAVGALFIVNDRADIARLVGADGVHLGQDDLPVKEARQILGPSALIGVSTHDLGQLRRAVLDGADYVGVGPTFPSKTKDFAELAGPDFVSVAAAETKLPAFAIGGIGPENIDEVIAAGASRVAVGAAITTAEEPRLAALAMAERLR